MSSTRRFPDGRRGAVRVAVAAAIAVASCVAGLNAAADEASAVALKAAFLFNFAKFAEWPALPSAAPIDICIAGDDPLAAALEGSVRGERIARHAIRVTRPPDSAWPSCHVLFVGEADVRRFAGGLRGLRRLPILTVSDSTGFSRADGIIELYVEEGRMRFAVNVDALERSGLRLSSRLLGLANVVRSGSGQ